MESCWKEGSWNSSVTLFAAISQVSTLYLCALGCCVSVCWAVASNSRWQASHKWRKKWSTRLTGLAAGPAVLYTHRQNYTPNCIQAHLNFKENKGIPGVLMTWPMLIQHIGIWGPFSGPPVYLRGIVLGKFLHCVTPALPISWTKSCSLVEPYNCHEVQSAIFVQCKACILPLVSFVLNSKQTL